VEATVASFEERLGQSWLADPEHACRFAELFLWQVAKLNASGDRPVIVSAVDRVDYLAGVFAAIAHRRAVFLLNPDWGANERQEAAALLPHRAIWLDEPPWSLVGEAPEPPRFAAYERGVMIPTGGTGGRVKFAVHTWETLCAAVEGYGRYWGEHPLNAIGPLPVCHVGGLMLALRTWITGGRCWLADGKLEQAPPDSFPLARAHASLVGAQLKRALLKPGHWLARCAVVLVGGGPTNERLVQQARSAGIHLAVAYGLTEAAATVAVARGDDGRWGEVLPHGQVSVEDGEIALGGPALFRGYWGQMPNVDGRWVSSDRGEMDGPRRLRVLGRTDQVIVSGGKKVAIDALAGQLAEWDEIEEAVTWAEPDERWGQRVVGCVVSSVDAIALESIARERLMAEARPKRWVVVEEMPRKPNGKPDWAAIQLAGQKPVTQSECPND